MAFGILECYKLETVPGTALLRDQNDLPSELSGVDTGRLKHGTGRYSHVVLVPQPSDHPDDPLNWPLWKKDLALVIVAFAAAVVGAFGPMLGPGFVVISEELGISVNTLSQATAWLILTLGLCVIIFNPIAKIYGKRPVYVSSIILLVAVCIWAALTDSYSSFLASRILGGIGMAPYEVLVQATISDFYFVHQRGTRIAVWNLLLLSGICGAGFISGYIIQNLGYQWTFWVCAILFGVSMIGILFFVPETTFVRPNVVTLAVAKAGIDAQERGAKSGNVEEKGVDVNSVPLPKKITGNGSSGETGSRMSYMHGLRLWTGRYTDQKIWKIFARPFFIFFYPAVFWGFLVYGTTLAWIVVFSVVNAVLFTEPPYNFSVAETGLVSLSPFVLTIIGEAISGPLNDWLCLRLAKQNHGVYEPEFRLVLIIPATLLGVAGFYGFGATVYYQTHWAGPVITQGLANMALAFASTCVFGYVLDCYPKLAEEAFVAINARNLLTFGLIRLLTTYFVNDWLARDGPLAVFNVLGSCFLAVCALTVPMWVFGKRIRSWIARNDFLNRFMQDQ